MTTDNEWESRIHAQIRDRGWAGQAATRDSAECAELCSWAKQHGYYAETREFDEGHEYMDDDLIVVVMFRLDLSQVQGLVRDLRETWKERSAENIDRALGRLNSMLEALLLDQFDQLGEVLHGEERWIARAANAPFLEV